jgi:RNA polymerase sigma factor (sigma-70 family)
VTEDQGVGADAALAEAFEQHRRVLVALCYRMTGSAVDAEDLVQDTFARALAAPPRDVVRDLRPWLMRVATHLSLDHLRRRKRARYIGPWLPEPIVTDADHSDASPPLAGVSAGACASAGVYRGAPVEARYGELESCSYAFLVALEALTPSQRAVLLLRDVYEYSGAEVAAALGLSESNARQILHRARAAMSAYDASRTPLSHETRARSRELLMAFMQAVARHDVRAVEALLAEDAVGLNDGGGRFFAARVPIRGRAKLARVSARLPLLYAELPELRVVELNGLPACVGRFPRVPERHAPVFASLLTPDARGRILATYTLIAPPKLAALVASLFPDAATRETLQSE